MANSFHLPGFASQQRLDHLIAQRLLPGVDTSTIDERIWDLFGETWSVMFTDLVGFSQRSVHHGIIHFLQTIYESKRLLMPIIAQHDGILLKIEGDSLMVLFRRPARALACARNMQEATAIYNRDKPHAQAILLCIGIGYGPVLRIGDSDVFGAEVNIASKLGEDCAQASEILVSEAVMQACEQLADTCFEPLDASLFGITKAYRVTPASQVF